MVLRHTPPHTTSNRITRQTASYQITPLHNAPTKVLSNHSALHCSKRCDVTSCYITMCHIKRGYNTCKKCMHTRMHKCVVHMHASIKFHTSMQTRMHTCTTCMHPLHVYMAGAHSCMYAWHACMHISYMHASHKLRAGHVSHTSHASIRTYNARMLARMHA